MTDITNLVLQELAPKKKESPSSVSVLAVYKSDQGHDPQAVLERAQSFIKKTNAGKLTRKNIVRETAILSCQGKYRQGGPNPLELLIFAIEYQEEGGVDNLEAIVEKVSGWISFLEKRAEESIVSLAIGTIELAIDYISDIFQDDTVDLLVEVTGKKPPTVKRWLKGGNCTWGTSSRISRMAKNFYMMKDQKGWSNEEVRVWLDEPLEDGHTPRYHYRAGAYYAYNDTMSKELKRIEDL